MTGDQPGKGWEIVLRRKPVDIIDGRPAGGYTAAFEIICRLCGDDPSVDYRQVSPGLRLVRGPYTLAVGIAADDDHIGWHERAAQEAGSHIPQREPGCD